MAAGCVLNKPPDTAAVKELALPGMQRPRSGRRQALALARLPTTGSPGSAMSS